MNARSLPPHEDTLVMSMRPPHPEKTEVRALKRAIHLELVRGLPSVDVTTTNTTDAAEQPTPISSSSSFSFDEPEETNAPNTPNTAAIASSPYRRLAIALAIGLAFMSGIAVSFAMQMAAHPSTFHERRTPRDAITRTEPLLVSGPESRPEKDTKVRRARRKQATAARAASSPTAFDPTDGVGDTVSDAEVDPTHHDLLGEGLSSE